jgi:TIR domain
MTTFHLFISHSSTTKELARHIFYNAISNGLDVWYDQALLDLGDSLDPEIKRGIDNSQIFLLLHCAAAMEKKWVPMEMQYAEARYNRDRGFRIIVVKLDNHPLPSDFWAQFLYLEWLNENQSSSIIRLLSSLTSRNPFVEIPASAVLSNEPAAFFINQSATIAEHSLNHTMYYLAHIKSLLSAVCQVGYDDEMRDTIRKVLEISIFEQLPRIQGGRFVLAPGLFEMIWPNRTRIPPNITLNGLPDRYTWSVVKNDEVSCRIMILEKSTGHQVNHPVPLAFGLTASAELF